MRAIFNSLVEPLDQLELIDHFEEEINRALKTIHCQTNVGNQENGLHETALKFRLLRQHGLYTSPGKLFYDTKGWLHKSFTLY